MCGRPALAWPLWFVFGRPLARGASVGSSAPTCLGAPLAAKVVRSRGWGVGSGRAGLAMAAVVRRPRWVDAHPRWAAAHASAWAGFDWVPGTGIGGNRRAPGSGRPGALAMAAQSAWLQRVTALADGQDENVPSCAGSRDELDSSGTSWSWTSAPDSASGATREGLVGRAPNRSASAGTRSGSRSGQHVGAWGERTGVGTRCWARLAGGLPGNRRRMAATSRTAHTAGPIGRGHERGRRGLSRKSERRGRAGARRRWGIARGPVPRSRGGRRQ